MAQSSIEREGDDVGSFKAVYGSLKGVLYVRGPGASKRSVCFLCTKQCGDIDSYEREVVSFISKIPIQSILDCFSLNKEKGKEKLEYTFRKALEDIGALAHRQGNYELLQTYASFLLGYDVNDEALPTYVEWMVYGYLETKKWEEAIHFITKYASIEAPSLTREGDSWHGHSSTTSSTTSERMNIRKKEYRYPSLQPVLSYAKGYVEEYSNKNLRKALEFYWLSYELYTKNNHFDECELSLASVARCTWLVKKDRKNSLLQFTRSWEIGRIHFDIRDRVQSMKEIASLIPKSLIREAPPSFREIFGFEKELSEANELSSGSEEMEMDESDSSESESQSEWEGVSESDVDSFEEVVDPLESGIPPKKKRKEN